MDGIKEISLRSALQDAGLRELPVQWSGDGFWVRAVILVRKRNFTESYALAVRCGDGAIRVVRDYGKSSQIYALIGVYPYEYLDERSYMEYSGRDSECAALGDYFAMSPDVFSRMGEGELCMWARRRGIELQTRRKGGEAKMSADLIEELVNGEQED